ncbi:MAG TPA: NADP-dependent malic enzyme [archaeon]|nr:NADP-dependent malic enzyme [archaeon]
MTLQEDALELHKKLRGKLEVKVKEPVTKDNLKLIYTPGVAEPCIQIAKDKSKVWEYTGKWNSVAVISDGSSILGLGNIGPLAGLPVMEGKAVLFKELGGIDAIPIVLDTQDTEEIIKTIKNISPSFGGINLEDIAAPRCFEVESRLQDIGIPVFHDDQHGTEIVVTAALLNACKALGKNFADLTVVISGAGAAGMSITKMLTCVGFENNICSSVKNLMLCDSKGIVHKDRKDLDEKKKEMAGLTNKANKKGGLKDALQGADVFIGVSKPNLLTKEMIKSMNKNPIIFAMANPVPEIMPAEATEAGAAIVGTGRSDFPNQINNSLAFPGVFRGALDARASKITTGMRMAAVRALSSFVKNPDKNSILPNALDKESVKNIAAAVRKAAEEDGVSQI